jgi:hypothetical protein
MTLLLAVPQMLLYYYLGGPGNMSGTLFQMTFGNQASSYANYYLVPLSVNSLYLHCENSAIEDFNSLEELQSHIGIMPKGRSKV